MRLPSLKSIEAVIGWSFNVIRRYEQDFNALAGTTVLGIAARGTTQATAAQLSGTVNEVTSVLANTGVLVPAQPEVTQQIMVVNAGANPLKVYPPFGAQINALGTNAPISLASGKVFLCYYASPTQIYGGLLS